MIFNGGNLTPQQFAAIGAAIPTAVFDFRGLAGLDALIDRTVQRIRIDLVGEVARVVRENVQARIRALKRDPFTGTPWRPRVDKKPHPLLVKSGKLLSSITSLAQPRGSVVTSFYKIAWFQQLGTRRGIPPRRFMGVGREMITDVQQRIDQWVGAL